MSNALPVGVFVVGRFHVDAVSTHIAETFEAMGHPVVRFEATARVRTTGSTLQKRVDQVRIRLGDLASSLPFVRERFARRLMQAARSRSIGLTVVCHDFLQPHEVAAVRDATGGPAALWFPDHIGNFGRAWFINAPYDALFF